MATVDADGTVHLLGRGSLCINTGGEKVYPEEVEAVLKAHPDVADAVVVGVARPAVGPAGLAVIEPVGVRPRRRLDGRAGALPRVARRLQGAALARGRRRDRTLARRQGRLRWAAEVVRAQ